MSKTMLPTLVFVVVICTACCMTIAQEKVAKPADQPAATGSADEAIRLSAQKFTEAFNKQDAKTIASQFTADAEYETEDGTVIFGRESIEQEFTANFQNSPGMTIETIIESVRFLGPGVAIENGSTLITRQAGEEPMEGRYEVIHINHGNGWQISRVREIKAAPRTNYHHLKELAWMLGSWVDEGQDSIVVTTCRWSKNKNYLLRSFKVRIAGRDAVEGVARIGWDPLSKKIKSWTFDTEGGYAEGLWTRDGDRWIVKSSGVLSDGQTASATNVFTYIDEKTCTWQSVDRIVGDEVTPNIEEVTVVRQPPAPNSAATR